MLANGSPADYRLELNERYWKYVETHFGDAVDVFDKPQSSAARPPVFSHEQRWRNVIFDPGASASETKALLALIPEGERHKWFGSMNSSQALALTVFGNLKMHDLLAELSGLLADEGVPVFGNRPIESSALVMEHKIDYLGEPRRTSLDGFINGSHPIAVECKFTESEVGSCSRPRLTKTASNYEQEHCNGNYVCQHGRNERCSLTGIGVRYWHYVPKLFKWENDRDWSPCPLNHNYQLVRNILAVGVIPDGTVSMDSGHAVLIYDQRNPAFWEEGAGMLAYQETQRALHEPPMLRKCSWQKIIGHLSKSNSLPWLAAELEEKYGLVGSPADGDKQATRMSA